MMYKTRCSRICVPTLIPHTRACTPPTPVRSTVQLYPMSVHVFVYSRCPYHGHCHHLVPTSFSQMTLRPQQAKMFQLNRPDTVPDGHRPSLSYSVTNCLHLAHRTIRRPIHKCHFNHPTVHLHPCCRLHYHRECCFRTAKPLSFDRRLGVY